jgi:hypothetical protein
MMVVAVMIMIGMVIMKAVILIVAVMIMIKMVVMKDDWLKKRKMVMWFCNQRACV